MPIPKKGESQSKYLERCVPIVLNEGTTKDPKQAAAICYSVFERHHKKSKGQQTIEEAAKALLNDGGSARRCTKCGSFLDEENYCSYCQTHYEGEGL